METLISFFFHVFLKGAYLIFINLGKNVFKEVQMKVKAMWQYAQSLGWIHNSYCKDSIEYGDIMIYCRQNDKRPTTNRKIFASPI